MSVPQTNGLDLEKEGWNICMSVLLYVHVVEAEVAVQGGQRCQFSVS